MDALATNSGYTQGYISSLENSERKPSRKAIEAFAKSMNISATEGLLSVGYAPDEEPEHLLDLSEMPEELRDALHYARFLTPQAQHFLFGLWKTQGEAHYRIEMGRQEAEEELRKLQAERLAAEQERDNRDKQDRDGS